MEQGYEDQGEDEIHQLDTDSSSILFTKEEHDNSCQVVERSTEDTEDFQRGYHLVVMDIQR